jgi:hypothetical protein
VDRLACGLFISLAPDAAPAQRAAAISGNALQCPALIAGRYKEAEKGWQSAEDSVN